MKSELVIVTYNPGEVERRCLEAVRRTVDSRRHRVTVIDNSTRKANLSYLWNRAIEESDAGLFCLMNSDAEPQEPGWLDRLCETAEMTGAAVGPLTNKCGVTAQISSGPGEGVYAQQTISGFCMAFSRWTWRTAGGFREDFPFYGQDSNFMDRIPRKFIVRDVWVKHEGGHSVRAEGRQREEQALGQEAYRRNREFPWKTKLLVLGSGPGNPFPLFRGVDQALHEFARQGMESMHLSLDESPEALQGFSPDVVIVVNTNQARWLRWEPFLRQRKAGLWFNDLRSPETLLPSRGVFSRVFLCHRAESHTPYAVSRWAEVLSCPVTYMPQASVIHPELDAFQLKYRAVFIGDTESEEFHGDRRPIMDALGATVIDSDRREQRAVFEEDSRYLYRSAMVCPVHSPLVNGYNSIRLYNVLAYGGLALVRRFPGLDRLFQDGVHLLTYSTAEEALEKAGSLSRAKAEEMRVRGWRFQQARHTVGNRLMNMVSCLLSGSGDFWGELHD